MSKPNQTRERKPRRKPYQKPRFKKAGTLAELTQGFAGSIPDEQAGQTKVNPFTG